MQYRLTRCTFFEKQQSTVISLTATCGVYAIIDAIYSDDSAVLKNMFNKLEVVLIAVDLQVV